MTAQVVAATEVVATPVVTEGVTVPMVTGKLRREKGRALLMLDVSRFHDYLDKLGVARDAASKRFTNAPASRTDVIDSTNHALVPKVLCSTDYKEGQPGVLEIDLLRHYTTPPTEPTLRIIAESVKDAAIAVVTHYQPVEISIAIVGKKAR